TDGPELGPLLALRPWLRGLRVTEIGSVAYPRMSRPARAEAPSVGHWFRLIASELRARQGRHSLDVPAEVPGCGRPRAAGSTLHGRAGSRSAATGALRDDRPGARPSTHAGLIAMGGLTSSAPSESG